MQNHPLNCGSGPERDVCTQVAAFLVEVLQRGGCPEARRLSYLDLFPLVSVATRVDLAGFLDFSFLGKRISIGPTKS